MHHDPAPSRLLSRFSNVFLPLTILLLAACTQVKVPAAEGGPPSAEEANDAWARVLAEHVDDQGRIDFAAVAADPGDIETYLAWLADADLLADPEAHLAELIDAYNALAMYNVVRNDIPESLGDKLASFFGLTQFTVAGEKMSLRELENGVIRKLGDPRIHFALNCMVRDCPRLPQEPWDPERLDEQLDRATREFLNSAEKVQVDEAGGVVRFNEILSFYTDDFLADSPSLIAYANRYRERPIPEGLKVEFKTYDWTVNSQP